MFDLNEFLDAPCADETFVVRRGVESFRLRRLNGAERLRFNDLTCRYDRVVFALARGLLNGADGAPIGEENAAKLLARNGALCEALFEDVFDATQGALDEERKIWERVKKKEEREDGTTVARSQDAFARETD